MSPVDPDDQAAFLVPYAVRELVLAAEELLDPHHAYARWWDVLLATLVAVDPASASIERVIVDVTRHVTSEIRRML